MAAAIAHAAQPRLLSRDLVWLCLPFAATVLAAIWIAPPQGMVAMLVCVMAAWRLVRPGSPALGFAFAGLSAGLAASLHLTNGVNPWLAAALAFGVLLAGIAVSRDARMFPSRLRDGVLLAVAWIALFGAAAPEVVSGWQSAQVLNQTAEASASIGSPLWGFLFATLALIAGAARAYWMKR
jgi:hypothetical protein